jgi:hypothetical protein
VCLAGGGERRLREVGVALGQPQARALGQLVDLLGPGVPHRERLEAHAVAVDDDGLADEGLRLCLRFGLTFGVRFGR